MNELIEQLVAHATSIQGPGPYNPLSFETFDKERFAQLIVQECAELNRKQSYNLLGVLVDMDEPEAEFDRVCLNTVNHVHAYLSGDALKQHFGFEE